MSSIGEIFDNASDFDRDNKKIVPSQQNIRVALMKLEVRLRYDVFANRMLIRTGQERDWAYLDDAAIDNLWLVIDSRFGFRPSKDFFFTVIRNIARHNSYHPILDYLDALMWDRVPRLETWLIEYAGAEDTPYVRAVSRLILLAAVRRIRHPGAKFDEILILESGQGQALKSSAIAALSPDADWFSDDLPLGADSKQVIERTSGKWLIEAAELEGIKSDRVEKLKAFLSRQVDVARMSYDRQPTERRRSFVIIGTTNSGAYLRDLTGNRRFWPVKVSGFDVQALVRDRDKLWAEACALEAEGASIRLAPELWPAAGVQQEERRVSDPWEDIISDAYGDQLGKIPTEAVWRLVGLGPENKERRSQEHNARLGAVMKRLGFERRTLRHHETRRPAPHYARGSTGEERERLLKELI